jgi:hypothetical protein
MADIHIDDFYRDAAKTFVHLYAQFPRPVMLYVEDIAGPDTPDDFGLHSPRHEACLGAFLWLAQTGYLHYKTLVKREAIEDAQLSHRAFVLLNSPLDAEDKPLGEGQTLVISQLRQQLREGSSFSLATLMKVLMASAAQ